MEILYFLTVLIVGVFNTEKQNVQPWKANSHTHTHTLPQTRRRTCFSSSINICDLGRIPKSLNQHYARGSRAAPLICTCPPTNCRYHSVHLFLSWCDWMTYCPFFFFLSTPYWPREWRSSTGLIRKPLHALCYDFYERPLPINVRLQTLVNSFSSDQIPEGVVHTRPGCQVCVIHKGSTSGKWHGEQTESVLPPVTTVFIPDAEERPDLSLRVPTRPKC